MYRIIRIPISTKEGESPLDQLRFDLCHTGKIRKPTTFKDLLDACRQMYVDSPNFNEGNFPLEPIVPDESKWKVSKHSFTEKITAEEGLRLLKEMEKRGEIRLCGIRRAMHYVVSHPDGQLKNPLLVPVTSQYLSTSFFRHVLPLFCWMDTFYDGRQRFLDTFDILSKVNPSYRWLVLRKKKRP